MKKILTALTILNTAAAVIVFTGIGYIYWYVNNETKQKEIKEFVGNKIKEQLPSLMPSVLPKTTGNAVPSNVSLPFGK